MLDWLIGSFDMFGVTIQNWMLAIGGGLLLYIIALNLTRRRQARVTSDRHRQ